MRSNRDKHAERIRRLAVRQVEQAIGGHPRLRTVLVEAAWRGVCYDVMAPTRYRQLVANTGRSKKAVVTRGWKRA